MIDQPAQDSNAQKAGDASRSGADAAQQGRRRKDGAAQVPPGSKTGSDTRQSAGGGASVNGPGGPDSGSDAMPGQSNAL